METIGERLKYYRKQKKISLAEAARRINVAESTYRDWEKGRLILGEPYLAICRAFGISLQNLFCTSARDDEAYLLINQAIETLKNAKTLM